VELQGKMNETNQKLRIADVQVEGLKKQIIHSELTDTEIQVSTGKNHSHLFCVNDNLNFSHYLRFLTCW